VVSNTTAARNARQVLESFERVLRLETHNLAKWPELLWQQLYNELQFEDEPTVECVERERRRRSSSEARPWFHRLTRITQAKELRLTLMGHDGQVNACAISPDASFIVSAGADGTLKIWEPATGKARASLQAHDHGISACAVSADGSLIVSASYDATFKVWDAKTAEERARVRGHDGSVSACAVSPDGSVVLFGGADGVLEVWDTHTREKRATLRGHNGSVSACAVSLDASVAVSGSEDGIIKVWNARTGAERATLQGSFDDSVCACAVSPDGSLILWSSYDYGSLWEWGSIDTTIYVWDARTADYLPALRGHDGPVYVCAFSADGSLIVSGSGDATLKLWDAQTADERATLRGHDGALHACAVSPDGSFIVSGGDDTSLKVWNAPTGELATPRGHDERRPIRPAGRALRRVTACAISPDGSFAVSASDDQTLTIWDVATGQERATLRGHDGEVHACAVSPDGSFIVSGSEDPNVRGALRVWDAETGEQRATLRGHDHEGSAYACAVSPDGSFIVSGHGYGELKVWDVRTGKERATLRGHDDVVRACAFSPDGSFIVSASEDRTLKLWDSRTGKERATLQGHDGRVYTCAVSPDGSFIVSGSEDARHDRRPRADSLPGAHAGSGILKVWDPRTAEVRKTLKGDDHEIVYACAISPDGSFIVSGGADRTLKIWDVQTGENVATIPLLGWMMSVAVHPWRPLLIAGDKTGNLNLVDIVGIDYGPIAVTAIDRGGHPMLRCPACFREFQMLEGWPGRVMTCTTPGCGLRLRVAAGEGKLSKPWWTRALRIG
jgi:WD40 repeat protein